MGARPQKLAPPRRLWRGGEEPIPPPFLKGAVRFRFRGSPSPQSRYPGDNLSAPINDKGARHPHASEILHYVEGADDYGVIYPEIFHELFDRRWPLLIEWNAQ